MAAGFFALLDDVASLLDDVAAMTKVATKKTAGVLGDDLALNANQVTGIQASRELPIIWAVSKGSLLNKAIIVPAAFLLSAFLPAAVPLVLMIGGAYLCYEGVEKILHRLLHHGEEHAAETADNRDPAQVEQEKIRAAIRTDFILSLEIIVIALASFVTAAVYGVVALIVKMDDLGLYWAARQNRLLQMAGRALLWFAPKLLKALSVAGTAAMFIVGGHLWVENIASLHHLAQHWTQGLGGFSAWWVDAAFSVGVGSIVGLALYVAVVLVQKLLKRQG